MKKGPLFILQLLFILLSCTDFESINQESVKSFPKFAYQKDAIGTNWQKKDTLNNTLNYYSSNDTVCNEITFKQLKLSEDIGMPKKLNFHLKLKSKLKSNYQITFQGAAILSSQSESFSDKSQIDKGDYYAADYVFSDAKYVLKIRLDIVGYEACVISIKCKNPRNFTDNIFYFIKKYPDYDVMKKGICK